MKSVFCNQFDICMDTGQHPHTWQSPVMTKHRCNCATTHPPVYWVCSWGSISQMFTSWACLPGAYNSQWFTESWPCVIEGDLGWSVKLWQSYLQIFSPEHNMKQQIEVLFPDHKYIHPYVFLKFIVCKINTVYLMQHIFVCCYSY